MKANYVPLSRQILDNEIWLMEKFTYGQAWVDLILLANHKKNMTMVRGIPIVVERGQIARSQETLGKRWKWERKKVRRFLVFLVQQNMISIVQQKNNLTSIISLIKYDEYNGDGTTEGTTEGTTNGTTEGQQKVHKQEGKDLKNTTKAVSFPQNLQTENFKIAWSDWETHRREKRSTLTSKTIEMQFKKLSNMGEEKAIAAIRNSIEKGWIGLFEPDPLAKQKFIPAPKPKKWDVPIDWKINKAKRELDTKNLPPEEYEAAVRELNQKFGV